MKSYRKVAFFVLSVVLAMPAMGQAPGVAVGTYAQDLASSFGAEHGLASIDVRGIAIGNDVVYAATSTGLFTYAGNQWTAPSGELSGPADAVTSLGQDVYAAIHGRLLVLGDTVRNVAKLPEARINSIVCPGEPMDVYVATDEGLYRASNGQSLPVVGLSDKLGKDKRVYGVAVSPDGTVAVAAEAGLFMMAPGKDWTAEFPYSETGRSWAPRGVRAVAYDKSGRLWFASPQGLGCFDGTWKLYTGAEGLPYNQFTSIACDSAGNVWLGTTKGAIRYDGADFAYRQGKRWLPGDGVRAIAVNAKGDAWFATDGGVGLIERRMMTLAEKAKFYEDEIDKYNRRTEYGYVLECRVEKPGDKSAHTNQDSDNDGLWTAMYGAGECFAYAATKDPKAKERAKNAFEALRFLSVAPVDGEVKQQPGYVARTVVPTTEPDPNLRSSYTLEGQIRNQSRDSLWKAYVPRWPLTKDKKYWYKTDTSSDELDGHYFFYAQYYDLVADSDEEKARVRDVVQSITDHLVRNDFCLVDHDGKPTRWAVYSPQMLNHEPLWQWERGLNSLSILSYLTVAEHMTGDNRYTKAIRTLCDVHAYDTNAIVSKLQHGFGSGNQSDDEMAIMCFYNIVKYTKDEALKKRMIYAFYRYMATEWQEMNPFFNFAYAALGQGAKFVNAYGTWGIEPWEGWLDDSIDQLKRFPLDRFNWAHANSHRIDITLLPRPQRIDPVEPAEQLETEKRGYRPNGKVIPVDERHFNHWNTDPWNLDYGGDGRGLADGAVFLLPYYMGLYHGFIQD
ncbi:MAG: hypothetical protein AMXMBFR4_11670 [Candidatus Hydrogenedentota bacterium]